MRRALHGFALVLAGALLAGCAAMMSPPVARVQEETAGGNTPVPAQHSEILEVLQYAERIRTLSPQALERAHTRAEAALKREGSPDARLHLALLLSLPDSPFRDEGRAQSLLRQYLARAYRRPAAVQTFAEVLAALLKRQTSVEETNRHLRQQLQDERDKSAKLQEQIDALKAIEKSINKSDQSTPQPTP